MEQKESANNKSQEQLFVQYLNNYQTILVTGPTGCGKSTNIPVWITRAFPETKTILMQPRRLATTRLAERICAITGYSMGKEVGFVMGRRYFESASNRLIFATTGSGMNMLLQKPDYYDFVIIDEIHEQSEQIVQTIALAF